MFKKGIEEGLYAEGKYLPAERTIGETHGVGRITVRNAMELLEADGLIRRIQGAGNLVVNPQGKQVPRDARTIVFVLSGDYGEKIRQPFIEGLFHHFEIECRNNGYRLLYVSLTKDDKVLDILQDASAVSGVVFVSTVARKFVQASLEAKIPVVMISSTYDGVVSINPDNIGGCFDATEQLIHTGSRNVAFISGIVTHHNASTRLIGYKRARYCNGLGYDETMVANGDWGFESGYECMISLLQAHPEINGVVAANDMMACGALRALIDSGRRVPEDVQIFGFDNIEQSRFCVPMLSTVGIDSQFIAELAIGLLENQRNGKKIVGDIVVRTSLICRGSSR